MKKFLAVEGKLPQYCWMLTLLVSLSLVLDSAPSLAESATPAGLAAASSLDGLATPNRERFPLPDYRALPPAESVLPPLEPAPELDPPLSSQARMVVKHIKLTGNSVFSQTELAQVTAGYENREISAEELQTLRRKLTLYYVERGYVNSGALIPDQQVKDGEVEIRIVEGRLTGVVVSGNQWLREGYISRRLERGLTAPLNMNDLGQNVLALHDGPVIKRVKARLKPGEKPGEAVLYAEIEEKDPWQLKFQLANDRSPSVGSGRLEADIAHRNLTGWGDTLDVRASLTEGLDDIQTSYSRPLNAADTTVNVWFGRSNSEVVEAPFKTLDISSKTETYGLSLEHPMIKTLSKEWSSGLTVEHRHGETFLLGEPFSFSPGAQDGEVDLTALRLSQNFSLRQPSRVLAFRQLFSFGMDALGATTTEGGPDAHFFVSLSQAQWAERLGTKGVQLLAKADLQLAREPLLYLEKFAMGGDNKVRGYRENLLTRDNGAIVSLELRVPVARVPLFGLSREVDDGVVQLAPFVDWGRSWNKDDPATEPKNLSSLGIGLRWDPSPKIHAQFYVAKTLTGSGVEQTEHDLQDAGIHFRLTYQAL